eukprot:scaffold334_cov241-Pinguiococcus_pyrenoidosus.AAC.26
MKSFAVASAALCAAVALLHVDMVFAFRRLPVKMAVSAAPPLQAAPSKPRDAGWVVAAASRHNSVLQSLDAALQDVSARSQGASLALLRISVPYGAEPDAALAAAAVEKAREGLELKDGAILGLVTPMRDADEHVVRISLGNFRDAGAKVFHLAAGQSLDRQSQLFATNEDKRLLLYPREDFLEDGMDGFLDRIYHTDPGAHPLGEPAWEEDVLFTADLATGELTIYEEGLLGVQLAAVNDLEKKWPWWQQSLVPMLRWLDRDERKERRGDTRHDQLGAGRRVRGACGGTWLSGCSPLAAYVTLPVDSSASGAGGINGRLLPEGAASATRCAVEEHPISWCASPRRKLPQSGQRSTSHEHAQKMVQEGYRKKSEANVSRSSVIKRKLLAFSSIYLASVLRRVAERPRVCKTRLYMDFR